MSIEEKQIQLRNGTFCWRNFNARLIVNEVVRDERTVTTI